MSVELRIRYRSDRIKKKPLLERLFFYPIRLFCRSDCFLRTYAGAGAAVNTGIGIDGVDVTGADGTDGALVNAGTTSYALVRNFVSHFFEFLKVCAAKVVILAELANFLFPLFMHNFRLKIKGRGRVHARGKTYLCRKV